MKIKTFIFFILISIFIILTAGLYETDIDLTDEELEWIENNPIIRLAPDPVFGPIEFFDDNGEYSGVAADYIKWIEEAVGVKFEIVHLENWTEVLEKAKTKEIDFLGAATKSEQRSEYLIFTQPYISIANVIITRTDFKNEYSLTDLSGEKVVVMKNYAAQEFIELNYPDIILVEVETIEDGLSRVSLGTSDYMVASLAQSSYYLKSSAITNLKVSGEIELSYDLAFAIRDDWHELQSIISKALNVMPELKKKEIYNKWISFNQDSAINMTLVYTFTTVLGVVIILLFLIFLWNRVLKRQVEQKTNSLNIELNEKNKREDEIISLNNSLEEKVKIRTNELTLSLANLKNIQYQLIESEKLASLTRLLISISHKFNTPLGSSITLMSFSVDSINDLISEIENETLSKATLLKELDRLKKSSELTTTNLESLSHFINQIKEISSSNSIHDIKNINIHSFIRNIISNVEIEFTNLVNINLACDNDIFVEISTIDLEKVIKNLILNSIKHAFLNKIDGKIDIEIKVENENLIIIYKDNGIGIDEEIIRNIYEPLFTTDMGNLNGFGLNIIYNSVNSLNGTIDVVSKVNEGVTFTIIIKLIK